MAKDTDEIVVGANGTIWVAPVGTTAPADEVAAPAAGWIDLGYASEDGVTFNDSRTLDAISVWQLFYAARRIVTEVETTISFVLRQWNKNTVPLAFGGGTVSTPTAGHHKFVPPAAGTIDERALMVDWVDGAKHYRLVVPKGVATEAVETNLTKSGAADLPIGFAVLGTDGVDPWYLLTDDPAFL